MKKNVLSVPSLRRMAFYYEPLDAVVMVSPRPTSRRFRMWWKGGRVMVTAPRNASRSALLDALKALSPFLLAKRPDRLYFPGQRITFPEGDICIREEDGHPGDISCTTNIDDEASTFHINIGIPPGLDLTKTEVARAVSHSIIERIKWVAHLVLIPFARKVADTLGRHPDGWAIGRGQRVLGSCDRSGRIRLSHLLVLLPHDLREYVVCHEIAHLSEMNHSSRFHSLLDSYLQGREKALSSKLKAFKWPVMR